MKITILSHFKYSNNILWIIIYYPKPSQQLYKGINVSPIKTGNLYSVGVNGLKKTYANSHHPQVGSVIWVPTLITIRQWMNITQKSTLPQSSLFRNPKWSTTWRNLLPLSDSLHRCFVPFNRGYFAQNNRLLYDCVASSNIFVPILLDYFKKLIALCENNNHFRFEGSFCIQIEGVVMKFFSVNDWNENEFHFITQLFCTNNMLIVFLFSQKHNIPKRLHTFLNSIHRRFSDSFEEDNNCLNVLEIKTTKRLGMTRRKFVH